jgi:hypothetical protein
MQKKTMSSHFGGLQVLLGYVERVQEVSTPARHILEAKLFKGDESFLWFKVTRGRTFVHSI